MQSGDISNDIASRLIVVFDNTIGTLTPVAEKRRRRFLKVRQYHKAANCWEVDPHMVKVLVDWQYRTPYNVDVATFTHPDEAAFIEERLEGMGVPFGNFLTVTIEELSRVHANMPHVAAIFDATPGHRFTYGGKSRSQAVL